MIYIYIDKLHSVFYMIHCFPQLIIANLSLVIMSLKGTTTIFII